MRVFSTGATRDDADNKPDIEGYLSTLALDMYFDYMLQHQKQADGKIRASDNWQAGLPYHECLKSLLRHVFAVWYHHRNGVGEDPCTSLCAVIFNAQAMLDTLLKEDK